MITVKINIWQTLTVINIIENVNTVKEWVNCKCINRNEWGRSGGWRG